MHESIPNIPTIESQEDKRTRLNMDWYNPRFSIEVEGKKLSLRECYEMALERSNQIFEATREVALREIPEGKYILFVNSAQEGLVQHKELSLIDRERLEYMYEAETGSRLIDSDAFQRNNMLRCLGLKESDNRFMSIDSFRDEIPKDLSDCVGIVFGGSEADITDEAHLEKVEMIKKTRALVQHSSGFQIPKLGICFGGQLLAHEAGAKIDWILNERGEKSRTTGLNAIRVATQDENLVLPFEFSKTSYSVAQNHGQEIVASSLPRDAHIVATSADGKPELVYFLESNTISTQFHPEVSVLRLEIAEDLNSHREEKARLFKENPDEMRAILFPNFLKMAGEYVRKE